MRRMILAILPLLCACEGEAEKAVRRGMLDPDATQFRDVRQCTGDRAVWRGEANGKNSFGAYTGFKPFFFADGIVAYAGDGAFTAMMDRCYSDLKPSEAAGATATADAAVAIPSPKATKPKPKTETSPAVPANDLDSEVEGPGRPNLAAKDQCWMDYCPCDTSDPDYGYADIPICRNLRAGLPVDDQLMAGGAASRDARRALREHKDQYGSF